MKPLKITIAISRELLIVLALSFAAMVTALIWPAPALRISLGLAYVLFLPGYALVAALFPGRDDLPSIQRFTLAVVLSLSIVSLLTLLLNWTPWGVTLVPTLVSVTSFIGLACGVAYYRRSRLAPDERFVPQIEILLPSWASMSALERILMIGLTLSIVLAVGVVVYFVIHPKVTERYTEFYVLGADRLLEGYPQEAVAGEPITLVLGVINHEHERVAYRMMRAGNGRDSAEMARIVLDAKEKWEEPVTFFLTLPGEDNAACYLERVSFVLYKEPEDEPYRSVYLDVALLPSATPVASPTPNAWLPYATSPGRPPSSSPTPLVTTSPTLPTPPTPTPIPTSWSIHIVKPRETLSAISRLYDVSADVLILVNDLPDPDLLEVGQEILIPQRNGT
jgi:uncharacterized membrane protein/LysM repeat protein